MSITIGLPQFGQINAQDFTPHLEAMLTSHLEQVDALVKKDHPFTWDNLIEPLDDLADELDKFWSPIAHLHAVMDSKLLRERYQACLPLLSAYEAALGQNQALYQAIGSIDTSVLNPTQQKIIEDSLEDFRLSGVALKEAQKKRFEVIETRLSELSNQFEHNIIDATQAFTLTIKEEQRLSGLPEHARNTAKELAAAQGSEGYVLSLEAPCFQAVMCHADDMTLRQTMHQAYFTRASELGPNGGEFDNTALINEILQLRHEKANLLGFKHYAQLSLATKMANSEQQVLDFIHDLVNRARLQAEQEFVALKQFAVTQFDIEDIMPWDVAYLSEKRRQALFSLSQEELRPYFPQFKIMQGLFEIINTLFGVRLEIVPGVNVWHKDVSCYAVIDAHNQVRGYVYVDLFARTHKRGGAWMNSLQSRRKLADGTVQLPIATLTCNFAKPSAKKPAMLSHDEVLTLFHEFGHCLHHLLTQVDCFGASGISGVEWDAVELPSQFFENWCWEKEALALLSAHIDTGETLPDVLLERLMQAKNFHSALSILRQMEFSLCDFRLHQAYEDKADFVPEILAEVRAQTNIAPTAPYNRFLQSFAHIFAGGYAAGYYSYSWAEVLSSDAFARFEEEGIFNLKTGQDFLRCILEVGGSKKAANAFLEFRGRPATLDAYLRHNGIQL